MYGVYEGPPEMREREERVNAEGSRGSPPLQTRTLYRGAPVGTEGQRRGGGT